MFDPSIKIDSSETEDKAALIDTTNTKKINKELVQTGSLHIISPNMNYCVFQLLQNEKVVNEFAFSEQPYDLLNIMPGKYQLKYINDINKDGKWNTGDLARKKQPEEIQNYPSEINIRSNWDLEITWQIRQ